MKRDPNDPRAMLDVALEMIDSHASSHENCQRIMTFSIMMGMMSPEERIKTVQKICEEVVEGDESMAQFILDLIFVFFHLASYQALMKIKKP